jgi:hypothetical protein
VKNLKVKTFFHKNLKFPKKNIFFYFSKSFSFVFNFCPQKVTKFCSKKQTWKKRCLYKNNLGKNIFLDFSPQKVTKFCSKKQNWKKIFLYKNNFGKNVFLQKNIYFEFCVPKND